tara:strand:+ start:105 stop:887 length:783 start_codon:yes stop_codon:yes gene_type:complete
MNKNEKFSDLPNLFLTGTARAYNRRWNSGPKIPIKTLSNRYLPERWSYWRNWGIDDTNHYRAFASLFEPYHAEAILFLSELFVKMSKNKGNMIEIGAGHGVTTVPLAVLAAENTGYVVVIDPFESGWDEMPDGYGKPYPYEIFKENIREELENSVKLYKEFSNAPGLIEKLQQHMPFAFAFLDGMQYEENVLEDLNLMDSLEVQTICVDDYGRKTETSQVTPAVDKFLKKETYSFQGVCEYSRLDGSTKTNVAFLERRTK